MMKSKCINDINEYLVANFCVKRVHKKKKKNLKISGNLMLEKHKYFGVNLKKLPYRTHLSI